MIPCCILIIEDENDRTFMAELYLQYNRLMYSVIYKIIHDMFYRIQQLQG